jgi:hypothetical protein
MSRLPRPARSGGLLNLLPPKIREELRSLERDRDDDNVTAAEWHSRADRLIAQGTALPGPLREAFLRSVRGLARNEEELERKTGNLVGLPKGADQDTVRASEADLRRRIAAGELSDDEAQNIKDRLI